MSLTTYADLKTAMAAWLHRSDLTSLLDDFVTLAEARINADLDTPYQQATQAITTTAPDSTYALPSDFQSTIRLTLTYGGAISEVPMRAQSDVETATEGIPGAHYIEGGQIVLMPIPDTAYTLTHTYKKKLAALSSAVNDIYSRWPKVYLYAALLEAVAYTQDDSRGQLWEQVYGQAVAQANRVNNTKRLTQLGGGFGNGVRSNILTG